MRKWDVSSCHNTDLGMRNPIFRSRLRNSGVQRGKYRKFEFRKTKNKKDIKQHNKTTFLLSWPHEPMTKKQVGKSSKIRNLDVSSCHNTDFGMRNPIFRSKLSNSGVQSWKYSILNFRKKSKKPEFINFDLKIGFLMPRSVWWQLETSRFRILNDFSICFLWVYGVRL